MESDSENKENGVVHLNGIKNLSWPDHVTVLDLSHRNISSLDEKLELPQNLSELNLSHNSLVEIPACVLKLSNVKHLEVSFNFIQYFDETPSFLHIIEQMNISNNHLHGPPYWVWLETPKKLCRLDISCNPKITVSVDDSYLEELMQYKTLVTDLRLFNCELGRHLELLGTFVKAKVLEIGSSDLKRCHSNAIEYLPCKGLDQCCDIQRLNLVNTQLYTIERNIDIYKHLIEINISHNYINSLPKEFCNLENLKVCILSENSILYMPDEIVKLKQLERLYVDSNQLCVVPENFNLLPNLKVLDLYNNSLCEIPEEMNIQELDLAQNYLDEPETEEYLQRKERLRLNSELRYDGRKPEPERAESMYSTDTTEDMELLADMQNLSTEEQSQPAPVSEDEDWDSDDYWVPAGCKARLSPPVHPTWFYLVKRKMEEGNFCPMDIHLPPVHEKITMERRAKPKVWVEVEGQFDDLSDDDG